MRIVEMQVTPIAISDPPLLNASGLHAPYALRTILELTTDGNVTGISEIPGSSSTNAALELARQTIIGCDPFQLNALRMALERQFADEGDRRGGASWDQRLGVHIYSAVEVACLDIIGKETNRPVADLLGGAVRPSVPFAAYLFCKPKGAGGRWGLDTDPAATGWAAARQQEAMDPDGIVRQAKAMCEEFGFRSIKLKGGVLAPAVEVETMLALREAFGPETPLRIDPNAVWRLETAIECGRQLRGVLEYYEDPVRGQQAMASLRQAVDIPLATNMCTTSFADLPESIRLHSEDVILCDHHFWGGLRACVELGRICRTFGRGLSMHSNSHVGVSLAAMTHLASAVPNLSYSLDTHYPWQCEDVLVGGPLKFQDGGLSITRQPGLGVQIDPKALQSLHENFNRCGLTRRDDEAEMQKIQPGWKFQAARW